MRKRALEMPEITQILRGDIERAGGVSQWARRTGVNRAYVSKVLHGHKQPGLKIIRALGLEATLSRRAREVLRILGQEIDKAGSQSEWARRTGINRTTLNQVISGRRKPGPDIFSALQSKQSSRMR
jgi:DNA-binding phage protein